MSDNVVVDALRAQVLRLGFQRAAIEAIADHRLAEAVQILETLQRDIPIVPGQCRYCGCSELRGCAIVVPGDELEEPVVVRCTWVDAGLTVCSNVACITRWRQDSPEDVVSESGARIVVP